MPKKRERTFASPKEIASLCGLHPATVQKRARAGTILAERDEPRGRWTVGAERSRLTGRWRLIPARGALH